MNEVRIFMQIFIIFYGIMLIFVGPSITRHQLEFDTDLIVFVCSTYSQVKHDLPPFQNQSW